MREEGIKTASIVRLEHLGTSGALWTTVEHYTTLAHSARFRHWRAISFYYCVQLVELTLRERENARKAHLRTNFKILDHWGTPANTLISASLACATLSLIARRIFSERAGIKKRYNSSKTTF